MQVFNRDGEPVDLPISYSRQQLDAALEALGIPTRIGIRRTIIEPFSVTVELNELGPDGKVAAAADGALVQHTVKIPMAGRAAGGPVCGNGPDLPLERRVL